MIVLSRLARAGVVMVVLVACGGAPVVSDDAATQGDAGRGDGGRDAAAVGDAGVDAAIFDAGTADASPQDGGADASLVDDAGSDAGFDAPAMCAIDADCDDGTFCNGAERCSPGDASADAFGCVASAMPACTVDTTCDEGSMRCLTFCDLHGDQDGDGHMSIACAGDDCDDTNAGVYPGATELCDRVDTNCSSGGGVALDEDADDDMHAAITATCTGGFPTDDCNDANVAVHPGQLAYSATPIPGAFYPRQYDYDCDGTSTPEPHDTFACGAPPSCSATAGWYGGVAPPCGNGTSWASRCSSAGTSCYVDGTSIGIVYQACR